MALIAFVCAMPMELKPLVKKLQLRDDTMGDGVQVRTGNVGHHAAVATVTGMGPELATNGTNRLLGAVTPDHLIVFGITGAVDNETPIGTLVVPATVVDGASGAEHHPTPVGTHTPKGVMWTTDRITPPDELPGLRQRGVVSLDMETAAIAACCEAKSVPWSVVRVVSDRATDGSVDDEIFHLSNQDGTPNGAAVAKYFLRHPQRIPRLATLAKGARLATERAATAAVDAALSLH